MLLITYDEIYVLNITKRKSLKNNVFYFNQKNLSIN